MPTSDETADLKPAALEDHEQPRPGKMSVMPTRQRVNQRDLALAYSPGVGAASEAVAGDPAAAARYTAPANRVPAGPAWADGAVLPAGTAVGMMDLARLLMRLLLLVVLALGATACARDDATASVGAGALAEVALDALPAEARQTLALIRRGGPFPYRKDGTVFGNRERLLPQRPRGYYTEYTVTTPGSRDRGARRIVAGKGATGDPATSDEYYYSSDHYQSFRRIRP